MYLCDLVRKECHKATTLNGVPRGKGACDGAVSKLVLCLVCCLEWYLVCVNSANILCYNKIIRVINVLLGSSLPSMGGGGCYD